MKILWDSKAWEEYLYWQTQDKKTLKKINKLIKDIERKGADRGIGKPERLKDNLSGLCSRRIDNKNRLVYFVSGDSIEIISCKNHYTNK